MSKLTLTIDPEVVRQAKKYAAEQQQSLSKLVENFLRSLSASKTGMETALTGVTAGLAGIISKDDLDSIESYTDYLQEKYQ